MGTDLRTGEIIDDGQGLGVIRQPEIILAEAKKAAVALKTVLEAKPHKVIMNGEQYLEFEDWQTVARFYGATVKVLSTSPVQVGDAIGFEARAIVLDNRSGIEISAADAMCLNDEDKWSKRPKYEWETINGIKARKQVGEEAVPMFQLRSMAQTRACAKALRNVFAWVVVLAGYKPTPAEELDIAEKTDKKTKEPESTMRMLKSQYKSKCDICAKSIEVGMEIMYDFETKKKYHTDCIAKMKPEVKPTEETNKEAKAETDNLSQKTKDIEL